MPENIDNTPQEEVTTHNKRASFVAIALVLIVTVGLVIQSFLNYQSRSDRTDTISMNDTQGEIEEANTMRDFKEEKDRADRQRTYDEAKKIEDQKRQTAYKEMGRVKDDTTKSVKDDPYQDVYMEFQRGEIKRVLQSRQAGFRQEEQEKKQIDKRLSANRDRSTSPETERINQEIQNAQRKREELRQLGDQINQQLASIQDNRLSPNQAGLRPGGVPTAALASELKGQKVVGEPAKNRKQEGQRDAGPRPGEVLLPTGTVMSGVLDMEMISDYDGPWRGLLVRDVYDVEKKYILFPKGTRIVGRTIRITNVNEAIQARMAMGVKWAILPNGNRIDFTKTVGLDTAGVAAIKDKVNYHILAQLLGLTAYAVLGAGPSLSLSTDGGDLSSREQALADITGGLRDTFGSLAQKYLNIVPTITIRAGTPFKIFTEDDLYIKPWARVDSTIYTTGSY